MKTVGSLHHTRRGAAHGCWMHTDLVGAAYELVRFSTGAGLLLNSWTPNLFIRAAHRQNFARSLSLPGVQDKSR